LGRESTLIGRKYLEGRMNSCLSAVEGVYFRQWRYFVAGVEWRQRVVRRQYFIFYS
jgi:hypothetical protein